MKKNISKSIIALTSLMLLGQTAFADNANIICPTAENIKNMLQYADVNSVIPDNSQPSSYDVIQANNFNTGIVWWFEIMGISATSQADALAKAKSALPTLVGTSTAATVTPYHGKYKAVCLYNIDNGYSAIAVNLEVTK